MEFITDLARVNLKTTGLDLIPKNQKFLLVYNHTSKFDPIIQSFVLRKEDLIHVSKPENFKIPIAGNVIYRDCFIAINRENNREAIKTINKAITFIKDNKFCVGISPEGTRNKGDVTKLLPFRNGCFHIALKAK